MFHKSVGLLLQSVLPSSKYCAFIPDVGAYCWFDTLFRKTPNLLQSLFLGAMIVRADMLPYLTWKLAMVIFLASGLAWHMSFSDRLLVPGADGERFIEGYAAAFISVLATIVSPWYSYIRCH